MTLRRDVVIRTASRLVALQHYSGFDVPRCRVCDVTDVDVLVFDHINDDGAEHRRTVGSGPIHEWLRVNGWPAGIQVLCQNHNRKKESLRRRSLPVASESAREKRQALRYRVLSHYCGDSPFPRCAGCGIQDQLMLEIDHVYGRETKSDTGPRLWKRLEAAGYPSGYQVLCANCNLKKGLMRKRETFEFRVTAIQEDDARNLLDNVPTSPI